MNTQPQSVQPGVTLSEELICKTSLFGALSAIQIQDILNQAQLRLYRFGELIFSAGDLPSNIYVVLNGSVNFTDSHGEHRSLHEGDTLGETAVIGIQAQAGTAVVSSETATLLLISPQQLMDIHDSDNELFAIMMMNIARDVSRQLHCQAS